MSHIPNSVMPHAGPSGGPEAEQTASGRWGVSQRAGELADAVRAHPRAAAAAGAAVVAGAVAAAAIPLMRSRKEASAKK